MRMDANLARCWTFLNTLEYTIERENFHRQKANGYYFCSVCQNYNFDFLEKSTEIPSTFVNVKFHE